MFIYLLYLFFLSSFRLFLFLVIIIKIEIDWENLRNVTPPYQPQVSGPDDTSNFDTDELRPQNNNAANAFGPSGVGSKESLLNIHLPFVGFTSTLTHDRFSFNLSNTTLVNGARGKLCDSSSNVYNHVIVNHENNVTVIETIDDQKMSESTQGTSVISSSGGGDSTTSSTVNTTSNTSGPLQSSINQNEIVNKLECDLRTARQEWSEVTAKLGEMKKEKSSLSTRLRCKEEEIEQQLEKNNDLRQQLRNAERIKRQLLDQIMDLQNELEKERQLKVDCKYHLLSLFSSRSSSPLGRIRKMKK